MPKMASKLHFRASIFKNFHWEPALVSSLLYGPSFSLSSAQVGQMFTSNPIENPAFNIVLCHSFKAMSLVRILPQQAGPLEQGRESPVLVCIINCSKGGEWSAKNMGLGKFWLDLEILEAFLMGLNVSFLYVICILESQIFFLSQWVSESQICHFFFSFGFQESNFSEFMGTAYPTELRD